MRAVSCTILLSLAFASIASVAHSQIPSVQTSSTAKAEAPAPAYDVMTIKPNISGHGSMGLDTKDGHFVAHNVSVKQLLQYVYDLNEYSVLGVPAQFDALRFDIEAKIVEPDLDAIKKMSSKQEGAMLLPLLTERLQLKTHTETRVLPVYELVVVKGSTKCKLSSDQTRSGGIGMYFIHNNRRIAAHNLPMAAWAKTLADQVHRTVIDKTGLSGNYDFELKWTPDDSPTAQTDDAPSIFTAVQEQLGLKLQPAKAPVEVLVVDHIELPSDN
jgi:uncharacterized protein (TIGR03435 family)